MAASMTTCGSMAASCAAHRNEVGEPSHRTTYSCSVPAPPAVAAGSRLAASRYTGPLDCSDQRRSVHCAASAAAQVHRGRSAAAPSSVTDAVAVPPVLCQGRLPALNRVRASALHFLAHCASALVAVRPCARPCTCADGARHRRQREHEEGDQLCRLGTDVAPAHSASWSTSSSFHALFASTRKCSTARLARTSSFTIVSAPPLELFRLEHDAAVHYTNGDVRERRRPGRSQHNTLDGDGRRDRCVRHELANPDSRRVCEVALYDLQRDSPIRGEVRSKCGGVSGRIRVEVRGSCRTVLRLDRSRGDFGGGIDRVGGRERPRHGRRGRRRSERRVGCRRHRARR